MKTIWKFKLAVSRESWALPLNAQILTAQVQNGAICIWALVDPDAPRHPRQFEVFGTGDDMDGASRQYLATIQINDGRTVRHVFERLEP